MDFRFIPAHTGNIHTGRPKGGSHAVHPRTHGEHNADDDASIWCAGSSPHTRGTSLVGLAHWQRLRFIPAHTGNIDEPKPKTVSQPVHPRTHGEHPFIPRFYTMSDGSSPHTRGTYLSRDRGKVYSRFIPAHTGNILTRRGEAMDQTVHPRTHGEHVGAEFETGKNFGSSPHTRGTSR